MFITEGKRGKNSCLFLKTNNEIDNIKKQRLNFKAISRVYRTFKKLKTCPSYLFD